MKNTSLQSDSDRIFEALRRVGLTLHVPVDRSIVDFEDSSPTSDNDSIDRMMVIAKQVGIFIKEGDLNSSDIFQVLTAGFPVIIAESPGSIYVCESLNGRKVETSHITDQITLTQLRKSELTAILSRSENTRTFLTKHELECESISASGDPHHDPSQPRPRIKPLRRFLGVLQLDQRDIWIIVVFGVVAGILSLATPLAVDALVSVVSWGTFLQPLLVLSAMLFVCLGLAAFLRILQYIVVEMIQRRQLIRFVGDFSHRFPRAARNSLHGSYPRELANRLFDVVTIQKASAVLLVDGLTVILTTLMGLILLGFYHPFLLGFDIVLLISMISITWVLGRGGISSAIDESLSKYRIAHWLQDVLCCPGAFKVNGGELLAVERANRLATDYIIARRRQFRVVLRQIAFAGVLQVVASTALLGLGGYLVIRQDITLGQLVASELVLGVVLGAFFKAGKSLESFYDVMAASEKVGHLVDLSVDIRHEAPVREPGPASLRWNDLSFHDHATSGHKHIHAATIPPGSRVVITGTDRQAVEFLLQSMVGLARPDNGMAEIAGMAAEQAALAGGGRIVGYAAEEDLFHGTIQENVDLGRLDVTQNRVRESLKLVGLWGKVLKLPKGIRAAVQTAGAPLSESEQALLLIARAVAGRPRLLIIDNLMDVLPEPQRNELWDRLVEESSWTLLVATNCADLIAKAGTVIVIDEHTIESEGEEH